MKIANAIVFIADTREKPVFFHGDKLDGDDDLYDDYDKSILISTVRVLFNWLQSCWSLLFKCLRIFMPNNSSCSVKVFFINRSRILIGEETPDNCIPDIPERIRDKFKTNNWRIEAFDHIYICCHLGKGGDVQLYERTERLDSLSPENWTCLAISKGNKKPSWWVNDDGSIKTLDKDGLIKKIEESNNDFKNEMRKPKRIVDRLTKTIRQFDPASLNSQNTKDRVIVIGWPYEEDLLENLRTTLFEKKGEAEVFIITQNGVFASTWKGWNGECLSMNCITHFHKSNPNAMIFALNIVPFGEDHSRYHQFFTDWMFVGWIDCFGKDKVRFYTKEEDSVNAMMSDLYTKDLSHDVRFNTDDCHIEERHKCLMERMQH